MACCLFDAKPLPEPMLDEGQLDSWEQIAVKFELSYFIEENTFENVYRNGDHFFQEKMSWEERICQWELKRNGLFINIYCKYRYGMQNNITMAAKA